MQPVGHGKVSGASAIDAHPGGIPVHFCHPGGHHLHTGAGDGFQQHGLQGRAPDTQTMAVPERRIDFALAVGVADAPDRPSRRVHPEIVQIPDSSGHQALAAGLVDRAGPGVEHHGAQPGACRVERGGQPGRSGSGDDEVGVDQGDTALVCGACAKACAKAEFSAEIRTRNKAALTTVKTTAVIHPVCTSGSAMPSKTTAT